MNNNYKTFGNSFERIFVALISIAAGITLIFLAIEGPLFMQHIKYKTADIMNNQLIGQDVVNMFVLSPILIVGGVTLLFRKRISQYLLIMPPLYLIYFVLSYTIGWEWSSTKYFGNNESYTFYFLFILISSLVILLYSLSLFPQKVESTFKKKGLAVYSILFSLFILIFASMWIKEVQEVISTGTTRGYDIAPTAFWVVRIFDLGFTIPLGLISVYLLWVRPNTTYPIQFMFYGFFLTMIIAVNAMGFVMLLNNDPLFLLRDLIVFLILALIIFIGFVYVLRNYKTVLQETESK
ncbi:MAG: hypothetical protein A3K31_05465 [Ignavibacteria bacterium RIFOXYA12_FULL_35_25]|nr:MAG: hypothetical protein A2X60_05080 [Ignavibacteria bacterium GWF2_35_20]OGU81556.1 MAG: hypothetical protein A2254_01220 [Ignavibacteria bacterium RIFOXYA2_FULL_35_9]OGU85718.1 MAG: hypothetical protein A3K31_05465 [Ignavibacteria bacterium RIFOXYA12_FULL_35_25]OGU89518.1 MAG: hypothetical protein A2492_11015 [Ignavibacteria bacterium RIFOXYC12_FULL_35_11]OGU95423.1 MAG: hypothetical protein A2347_05965 [Ignavibacteria bacterium RIFOXYB12_FULL_35_14]OGV32305.1 MAG: hypothetical protein A